MREYRQLDLNATLDSIAPEVRDYWGVVETLSDLGLHEDARAVLQGWGEEGIPSSSGPVFDEARRRAEALRVADADPGAGLEGLNTLGRDMNCPGCFLWIRGGLAHSAGRLREARDLFLAATQTGSNDYLREPLYRILAHERLGSLYEALGDTAEAAQHYAAFATYWTGADAELQPRVQAARDRAAALDPGDASGG